MNNYLSAAIAASLLISPCLVRADDAISSDKDKLSYSIGVDMGRNLKKQEIDVDPALLAQGLKDSLSGGDLKMKDEEMTATMTAFIQGMRAKMQEKAKAMQAQMKVEGEKNKTEGEKYLADNKKKEGWKTTPSGLQYKVLTTGTGPKPKATDTVVTQYRGTKIDGTEFDSSYKRNEPAEFPVNAVIPGWTEALQMMPVGSKWQLAIPSKLAYGENGPEPIGPNSVLLFDVELVGIKPADKAEASPEAPAPK